MSKIILPKFLVDMKISEEKYLNWLRQKTVNIAKRDRRKGIRTENYREKIHKAVENSNGKDYYTGEILGWHLISEYNNIDSKSGRRVYMKKFAKLPTIDHEFLKGNKVEFRVCGWLTNDCKNHLNHKELVAFCEKVIKHSKKYSR